MPRIPDKPKFPNPRTSDMKESLDKLKGAFENATKADGKVDLNAVASHIGNDEVAKEALDAIRGNDAFERMEERQYVGCGGEPLMGKFAVEPKELEGAEVQSVLSALLSAKMKMDKQDANQDGVINKNEADTAQPDTLAGEIADATVGTALEGYEKELFQWSGAINRLKKNIGRRQRFDELIRDAAQKHAETGDGCEALVWAYRSVATMRSNFSPWHEMNEELNNAETSFLRFVPFFDAHQPGHLSDKEIKKHLGTSDLKAFVEETKASIASRVGGDYEGHWLTGKDLEGHEQLGDPDIISYASAGC